MSEQKKHKLGMLAIVGLVMFALISDAIGLIPIAEAVMGTIFWGITTFVLWKKGFKILDGKRLATTAVSWIAGLIPFLQEFPQLTLGVIAIIIMSRFEEKTGLSISSIASGKMPSLNQNGVRQPPLQKPLNADGMRGPKQ